jgi:hypothetical protein
VQSGDRRLFIIVLSSRASAMSFLAESNTDTAYLHSWSRYHQLLYQAFARPACAAPARPETLARHAESQDFRSLSGLPPDH